jgi:hypothetical protein
MRPFLDSGFLLTLLLKTNGSGKAWEIARQLEGPLLLTSFQVLSTENRFLREMEADDSTPAHRAQAANGLQNFRWYVEQQVFQSVLLDYGIAIDLAYQWQRHSKRTVPTLLLLWPAMAVTIGATHFLSFDPRTRLLAQTAGLKLLPEKI